MTVWPSNPPRCVAYTADFAASLKTTEARTWLETNLHTGVGNSPEEFAAIYKQAFEVFSRAAKVAGIKPE
ncbi:MAG: hypothetical protein EXR28_05320 [Betaproteobacteria bacterium]|nr:hypothetical protein [Betaproteobacteria bacterium]